MALGSDHTNTVLFARKLRDRCTSELSPPGAGSDLSHLVMVDGIRGRVVPGASWTTTFTFSSADAYDENLDEAPSNWMILGNYTNSELGVGKLSY